MLVFFAYSGENETDDPSGLNVTDSVNKDDSEIAKSGEAVIHTDSAVAAENHLLGWDASATLTISANIIQKHELVPSESNQILDQTEKTDIEGAQHCSTLFIANLGPSCTEDELKQVLSQYPGFNALKVRARSGMPVAFADFEEVEQANEAKNALQGSSLPSSDRGGMHIEYPLSILSVLLL
ncbi:unnamed protein product [Ilex paraguariensis]|uniref:RRM domain-containing protein n=1 Tax=Ilex paraguariensis TaxID=185542 RepID=A0ABC8UIR0_9AQUA